MAGFVTAVDTAFRPWLEAQLSRIPRSSKLAEDIRYALGIWPGLTRFLEDGRLELDTNPVENQIRPIASVESLCPSSSSVWKHLKLAWVCRAIRASFPLEGVDDLVALEV